MNTVSSFILAFCICSVGIGALYMLCPEGNIAKSVKYIFCLVFICSIIPCLSIFKGFRIKTDLKSAVTEENAYSLTEVVIKQTFERVLLNKGINFREIKVFTDKTASDSISISEVDIYTADDGEKIRELFADVKDFKVNVINE